MHQDLLPLICSPKATLCCFVRGILLFVSVSELFLWLLSIVTEHSHALPLWFHHSNGILWWQRRDLTRRILKFEQINVDVPKILLDVSMDGMLVSSLFDSWVLETDEMAIWWTDRYHLVLKIHLFVGSVAKYPVVVAAVVPVVVNVKSLSLVRN
jgi:hypothetical protein